MTLEGGMFVLGYIVAFGGFIAIMQYKFVNDKVKRLQEEVRELSKARWEYERKQFDQLLETRRELHKQIMEERDWTDKLAEKLRHELKPETTRSMAAEIFKRMREDQLKQLEHSMDRLNSRVNKIDEDRQQKDFKAKMKEVERNLRAARGLPPLDDEQQPPNEEAKN